MIAIIFSIIQIKYLIEIVKKLCNAKSAKNKLIMKSPWSYFLLNVPKLSVYSNLHESYESWKTNVIPLEPYGELHSDLIKYIKVDRIIRHLLEYSSYSKSSPIFTNYKKLSDIIGSIREWTALWRTRQNVPNLKRRFPVLDVFQVTVRDTLHYLRFALPIFLLESHKPIFRFSSYLGRVSFLKSNRARILLLHKTKQIPLIQHHFHTKLPITKVCSIKNENFVLVFLRHF